MIIFSILTPLGFFGTVVGLVVAIFLWVKASGEQDPIKKKKINKKAKWFILIPLIVAIGSITLWSIIQVLHNS